MAGKGVFMRKLVQCSPFNTVCDVVLGVGGGGGGNRDFKIYDAVVNENATT